ncbi:PQQ-dependent sugar dehydrogenase [Pontibacter chitinilyticus]|uniref:PQQ-dependent sugar dehydrogenase n=1 Tax=Pontibacter chitinilyticus TaxID=2674989 RepID=UPI00321BC98D
MTTNNAEKQQNTGFRIAKTKLQSSPASPESFRTLPTPARPTLDASDVVVPEGYVVEPVMAGLSFPTDITFADDGTVFVSEGGSSWPTRPYMPARVIVRHPNGETEAITMNVQAGPRGISWRDGELYMALKGGFHMQVVKYNLATGKLTVLIDQIPSGGWHEPGGPIFGPDGLMYFGHGSVSQQGVPLPAGFTVDLAKHPNAHDVPGQDVTLTGNNVSTRDPRLPYPYLVETGAFKPFGTPAQKGEVIKGEKFCNSAVWRSRPDGTDVELLAWGIRNPFGMAINDAGDLYVTDNDFEEKGERAIANDPDRIWHIKNARQPFGSIQTPDWYGFPDLCGDGLPVNHEKHLPSRGTKAELLLENPPPWAGPAMFLEQPHSCMCKMDFSRSDAFGHKGELFVAEWGTLAPLNSPRPEDLSHGFRVIRVNVETGTAEPFFHNRKMGPASSFGTGGIERPVSCKFSPDGKSLYVLDFGVVQVTTGSMYAYAHTGVLWKVSRKEDNNG